MFSPPWWRTGKYRVWPSGVHSASSDHPVAVPPAQAGGLKVDDDLVEGVELG
jgi:hypothetical protein